MATGYRIFLKNGGRAISLENDADVFDMNVGAEEVRADGFHVGTSPKACFDYIDIPEAGEQVLITYEFDPENAGSEDGDGDIKVFRATVQDVEDLVPGVDEQLPLEERLSYDQLTRISEPKRKIRAQEQVRGPALEIEPDIDSQYLWFNFKSYPSTTGLRHRGYSKFLKPRGQISPDDFRPLEKVECIVDCTCPDYKFRWAWANKQRGSSVVGPGSLNQAFNRAPRKTNPSGAPGLCKHLLAMKDYVYGQSSNFPGGMPVAGGKMDKNLEFAKKRWINFDAEVAKAKQRDRLFRQQQNQIRQGVGVPVTTGEPILPEPLPGDQGVPVPSNTTARLSQIPTPEMPPEIGSTGSGAPPESSHVQPSFLNRMRDWISRGAGWVRDRFRRTPEPEDNPTTPPELPENPTPPESPENDENPNQQESLVFRKTPTTMKPLQTAISLLEDAGLDIQAGADAAPAALDIPGGEEEKTESEVALDLLGEIRDQLVGLNAVFNPEEEVIDDEEGSPLDDIDAPPTADEEPPAPPKGEGEGDDEEEEEDDDKEKPEAPKLG